MSSEASPTLQPKIEFVHSSFFPERAKRKVREKKKVLKDLLQGLQSDFNRLPRFIHWQKWAVPLTLVDQSS